MLALLLFSCSTLFGGIHQTIQKGLIIKCESSSKSGRQTDHHNRGAKVTFFDLGQKESIVYIEAKNPSYSSKRTYITTYSSGAEITLKRKGAERYVDTIFINTEKMEFVLIESVYLMGSEFNCTISEGKLNRN